MKLTPEDDGTLVDYCCLFSMHEHAEANVLNNTGLLSIRAGHLNGMTTGVLKAYRADSLQATTYVEPVKEAFRFSVASPFLSNGLSITRVTARETR